MKWMDLFQEKSEGIRGGSNMALYLLITNVLWFMFVTLWLTLLLQK